MKLYKDIDSALETIVDPNAQMPIRDIFALGCYLIAKGERLAGRKACLTALRALPLDPETRAAILKDATERTRDNFKLLRPHTEILDLFKSKP